MQIKQPLRYISCLSFLLSFCVGCGGGGAINAGTNTIDFRVIRIKSGSEIVGDPSNEGCRFTDQEITDIMNDFLAHEKIFGSKVNFTWNGNIFNVGVPSQFLNRSDGQAQDFLVMIPFLSDYGGQPDPSKINIYFNGCHTSDGDGVIAITIAPGTNPQYDLSPGGIFVNDQTDPTDNGETLAQYINIRNSTAIAHEVGHYIGRWRNRTLGSNQYDSTWHPINPTVNHLMIRTAGFTYNHLPGKEYRPDPNGQCEWELGEASQRIERGLFNHPLDNIRCP